MSGFERFHAKFGSGICYAQVTQEAIDAYSALLPPELIDDWRTYGWASYNDGILWTVNPAEYAETAAEWMPEWSADREGVIVVARTGFGDLLVSRGGSVGHLDVHYGSYIDMQADVPFFFELSLTSDFRREYWLDGLDGTITRKATKKLGPLAPDEIFTFEPALVLGGSRALKNVAKVKLFPHLSFLSQLFDEISIDTPDVAG